MLDVAASCFVCVAQAEELEDAKYADHFRSEGETFAAKGVDRKREIVRKQQEYAKELRRQVLDGNTLSNTYTHNRL